MTGKSLEMTANKDIINASIQQYRDDELVLLDDQVCSEEPLELRVPFFTPSAEVEYQTLAITMRTPGHDIELARGFLYSEGVIASVKEITGFHYCKDRGEAGYKNSLALQLIQPLPFDSQRLERRFTTYSSCGLCGKTSIQSLELQNPPTLNQQPKMIDSQLLQQFSAIMLQHQSLFQQVGSAHASGLFDCSGKLMCLYEDIGRHNALDKLIGHCLQEKPKLLKQSVLLVSGRASFELVQKTIMAGIPILASVGGPSSLAIETAKRFDLTLIGFLRKNGFNVYHGGWRLKTSREG